MKGTVHYHVRSDGVAVLTLDNPPVNALSNGVRSGLQNTIQRTSTDPAVKAIVITGAHSTFCAGADITEFASMSKSSSVGPSLVEAIQNIESSNKPVVAAIQRFAFGGGFEVALGAHYRVATLKSQVGLPEVNIGLLPGAGGTQRLPRLIGAKPAVEAMCSGAPIPVEQAHKLGIVDKIITNDKELVNEAANFILSKVGADLTNRRISNLEVKDKNNGELPKFLENFKKQMLLQRKGELAPQNIIKCVEAAISSDFNNGMKNEGKLFLELLRSSEARALQHIFFSERQAAKIEGLPKGITPIKVNKVGIIGAGTMGGGIAMCYANIGVPVVLVDAEEKFLTRGLQVIRENYERSVKSGRLTKEVLEKRMSLIQPSLNYEKLSDVDLVIEAVYEDMGVKKEIFKKLDKVCKQGAILATNTSALDIDEMATVTSRPEVVMGMHFFSPANVMRLVENVRAKKTSQTTIATCMEEAKRIGKIATLVGNCHGFVGNRMLEFYSRQANLMILEGGKPSEIDRIAVNFGMPMGPFQMRDLVGLDLGWQGRKQRGEVNPKLNVQDALCEMGRFGQKSNKGWYLYDENRKPLRDEVVEKLILEVAKNNNIQQHVISEQEVLERLFFPLINEGFKILEQKFAQRPSDIDIIYLYGYGFPRYRGGPMHYADSIGLDKLKTTLEKYAERYPKDNAWKVSDLLSACVAKKQTLAQYWVNAQKTKSSL